MEEAAPPEGPRAPDARPGCARATAIACLALLGIAVIAGAAVCLRMGAVISHLEESFVRRSLAAAPPDQAASNQVEAALDEYRRAALAADLGPLEWWEAGRAFERSAAAALLEARVLLADLGDVKGLSPAEIERGRRALSRWARGLAGGKISPAEYRQLLAAAAGHPEADGEDRIQLELIAITPQFLGKLIEAAEKLAAQRGVEEGPLEPDLATLIRRDLLDSLAAGKR